MNFIREIDCAHSRSMKNYLDRDSGNGVGVLTRKSKFFLFSPPHQLNSLNQSQDNFFMLRKCAQSIPRIKLPPDGCFQSENRNFFDFASIHRIYSLNQGQESVFMSRQCAQLIPRIKLPPYGSFLVNNFPLPKNFSGPKITRKHFFTQPVKN
jgi:hypothetical protein